MTSCHGISMEMTDGRERRILEMAKLSLNTTIFRRSGYGETVLDITLVSEPIRQDILDWRVIEDYTSSDLPICHPPCDKRAVNREDAYAIGSSVVYCQTQAGKLGKDNR